LTAQKHGNAGNEQAGRLDNSAVLWYHKIKGEETADRESGGLI